VTWNKRHLAARRLVDRRRLPLVFLALLPIACTHSHAQAMPAPGKVEAYVRAHWQDFGHRVDRGGPINYLTAPRIEHPDLVALEPAHCSGYYGAAYCTFNVTARFADGLVRKQEISTTFSVDARGEVDEVIVQTEQRVVPKR
jgi:hypothetical protein